MVIKKLKIIKNKDKIIGVDKDYNKYRLFGSISENISINIDILVFGNIELVDDVLGINVVEYMHFLKDMATDQTSYLMSIDGIDMNTVEKINKSNELLTVSIILGGKTGYELSNGVIPINIIKKVKKYTINQYNVNNIYNIGYKELGLPIDLLIEYHKTGGTIDDIKENPFIIARNMREIEKIKNNIEINDREILDKKIVSGITNFTIIENIKNKNISIDKNELRDVVYKLYPTDKFDSLFNNTLTHFEDYGIIKIIDDSIYTANSLELESRIIQNLHNRINLNKNQVDINKSGLSQDQYKAILNLLNSSISIVTGGPGTGKTYFITKILEILKGSKIEMIAPTGKAARKISEYSGMKSSTIHERYRIIDKKAYGRVDGVDILIVDEASMISLDILDIILSNTSINTNILFIGDINQLPPIGAGSALVDLVSIDKIPVVEFKNIYRQGIDSDIVKNAYNVLNNEINLVSNKGIDNDFFIMESINPKQQLLMIEALINSLINDYKYNINDIQVLCPTNIGPSGTDSVNKMITSNKGKSISIGDKVIQTINNRDKMVMNGEIGYVKSIDSFDENKVIVVEFSGRDIEYMNEDIEELDLAYAISIHKSQGSEFPITIIPMYESMNNNKLKQLLYTGITRATDKVILISDRSLLNKIITSEIILNKSNIPDKINNKTKRVQI